MHTTIQLYLQYLHSHTTRILSVMPWWLREQKQRGEKRTNAEYFRPIILSTFPDRRFHHKNLPPPLHTPSTHTDKHAACTLCNLASTNFAGTNKIHTLNFVMPSIVHVFHVCEGLTPAPSRILNAGTLTWQMSCPHPWFVFPLPHYTSSYNRLSTSTSLLQINSFTPWLF